MTTRPMTKHYVVRVYEDNPAGGVIGWDLRWDLRFERWLNQRYDEGLEFITVIGTLCVFRRMTRPQTWRWCEVHRKPDACWENHKPVIDEDCGLR